MKNLHIHAQMSPHDPAWIAGDTEALRLLRGAIDRALAEERGRADVSCADGNAYAVVVIRIEIGTDDRLPYMAGEQEGLGPEASSLRAALRRGCSVKKEEIIQTFLVEPDEEIQFIPAGAPEGACPNGFWGWPTAASRDAGHAPVWEHDAMCDCRKTGRDPYDGSIVAASAPAPPDRAP